MKLENKIFGFDNFAAEMAKLKNEQHFDYLVTIVGEDSARKASAAYTSLKTRRAMSACR